MEVGYCLGLSLEAKAAYDKRILELEKENTELLEKVEQLQAERDAAVEDMATAVVNSCDVCMHNEEDIETAPCNSCMHIFKGRESKFKWRGVQKEE